MFMAELMVEERRLAMVEEGLFLGTVHAAKGLEFDRVFLLDGGWEKVDRRGDRESTRRLFYVGLTRARRELDVLAGERHPFVRELGPVEAEAEELPERVCEGPPAARQRITRLALASYFIDYAGRQPPESPVHAALAALRVGSRLDLRSRGTWTHLCTPDGGQPVAALSTAAREEWRDRRVEEVRVLAIEERRREQSQEGYRERCRVDRWEVPLVEVLWRE